MEVPPVDGAPPAAGAPPAVRQRILPPSPESFQPRATFNVNTQNKNVVVPLTSPSASSGAIEYLQQVRILPLADCLNVNPSFGVASILQITNIKPPPPARSNQVFQYSRAPNGGRSIQGAPVLCDLSIFAADVLANNNKSLVVMFQGQGQNPHFWDADYGAREHIMRPGAFILVRGPKLVHYLGLESEGRNQMIIKSTYPVRFIKPLVHFHPDIIDNSRLNMHAVVIESCTIGLSDMNAVSTRCSGQQCNQQFLVDGQFSVKQRCCCSVMSQFSNLALVNTYAISTPSGDTIEICNDTNRSVTNEYILTDPIESGTSLSRLQAHIGDVFTCYENVLEYINSNGGFTVTMWLKRGRTLDRTANDDSTGYGNRQERTYIVSPTVYYHLVSFVPTEPGRVQWNQVYPMKFDTSRFNGVV